MNIIHISDEAVDDLNQAHSFYEKQELGLGAYFLSQISADIDGLKITGGIHRKTYKNIHRVLSKKFPYSIFYLYSNSHVLVIAITDNRRNPQWIKQHLGIK